MGTRARENSIPTGNRFDVEIQSQREQRKMYRGISWANTRALFTFMRTRNQSVASTLTIGRTKR